MAKEKKEISMQKLSEAFGGDGSKCLFNCENAACNAFFIGSYNPKEKVICPKCGSAMLSCGIF